MEERIVRRLLGEKSVAIAGAGGLGSNCAALLARAGIGRLVIADFDVVSLSNLNRQFFFRDQVGMKKVEALKANIFRIDPGVVVEAWETKLDPEKIASLFQDCDVVVEALDRVDMKAMLIETAVKLWPGRPLVAASGLAGFGGNNRLRTRILGDLTLCGDGESEVSLEDPPLGPRVAAVAALQANRVLEVLLKVPATGRRRG